MLTHLSAESIWWPEACESFSKDQADPGFLPAAGLRLAIKKRHVWTLEGNQMPPEDISVPTTFPESPASVSLRESGTQAVIELLPGLLEDVDSCDQGYLQVLPSLFPSHLYLRPQLWTAHPPAWPPLSNQCLKSSNTSLSTSHWTATRLENHVSKQDNTSFFSCHPRGT